jgi:phospho-N-acetylmuramoyl-pentapeptide-transferase
MLYFLFYDLPWLRGQFSLLNVVRYITVRTAAATITALVLSLILGPWLVHKLREFQIGQIIRTDGPESHRAKSGTPTMGGLLILLATIVPTLLWANLRNPYVWVAVLTTLAYGAIGFADDYQKIVRQ